jgi:hypothetical protein
MIKGEALKEMRGGTRVLLITTFRKKEAPSCSLA